MAETGRQTLVPEIPSDKRSRFCDALLAWFSKNGRLFPWRSDKEPYHNLVAEFLLQKTNAEKVEPVYVQLVSRYPTVADLAKADLAELSALMEPLGLRYRIQRLKATAETLSEKFGDLVPNTFEELRGLPGVGDYMANAILCFAFGQPRLLIDTNSARVLTRVFA